MATYIILFILILIVVYASYNSYKHFKGEGDCCGGSVAVKEKDINDVKDKKLINITGMHCENCAKRIQNKLNELEGLKAEVSFKDKKALLKSNKTIDLNRVKQVVNELGYEVNDEL